MPLPHREPWPAGRGRERHLRLPPGVSGAWVSTACRLALGAVWIWAGVAKAADPFATLRSVRAYQLLPEGAVQVVAFGLPFFEIALGGLLVLGLLVRPVAVASLVVLGLFTAAIASAWARGLNIDCGCFGASATQGAYGWELLRDVTFSLLAARLVARTQSRLALERSR
jgi:uncharacterized membrane protein YphA (DoxX/SURF4 family)